MLSFNQFLNESRRFYATDRITNSLIDELFPIGKHVEYSQERLELAISLGMVIEIGYKGLKDSTNIHKRTICPMILGYTKRGKFVLRAHHLLGWSVSINNHITKIWRMFRPDNVQWMLFNGQFFRDAPQGYNHNDPLIINITLRADFNRIKANQNALKSSEVIESEADVQLPTKLVVNQKGIINLLKPNEKSPNGILPLEQYTFLKDKTSPNLICIEGGLSQKNKIITITIGTQTTAYSVYDSFLGNKLPKNINGQTEFNLYVKK